MSRTAPRPRLRPAALVAELSRTTKLHIVGVAILGIAARFAVVWTAFEVTRGAARDATLAVVLGAAIWLVQRAAISAARVRVECDLHRSTSRTLLESDVLRVPAEDLQRVVFESNGHARGLLAQTLPSLVADLVASFAIAPLVIRAFPARVLVLALVAFVVVVAMLLALRGVMSRLQAKVLDAYQRVAEELLVSIDGRLEVAAGGREREQARALDGALGAYLRLSRRAALGAAVLGRVPLAAGAITVAAAVIADASSREALAATVIAQAVLLAATSPAFLGVLVGANELIRAAAHVEPLVHLLAAQRRPELARRGAPVPELPTEIAAERLAFAYEADGPRVLEDVSFRWAPGKPLVFIGPNGSGKSTLLRLVLGLRPPTGGTITFGGRRLDELDLVALRRVVAFLPQRPYLGEAYFSVRHAMRLAREDASDAEMREALERTKVLDALHGRHADPLDVPIGEVSAGQRQRIALARVLLQGARLVLLDEPDANLDREGIALVRSIVEDLSRSGMMVILAAHTQELAQMPSERVVLG